MSAHCSRWMTCGSRCRCGGGSITVVDGVDYAVAESEVFGVAGESGSGKTMSVLALIGCSRPARPQPGARTSAGSTSSRCAGASLRNIRGRRDRDGVPGPDDVPAPDALGRPADRGAIRQHLGVSRAAARKRAAGAARRRPAPRSRARAARVPAPVLGRHATARRDRDRARRRARAPDRRRADDGARRDRAGGHHPAARPAPPRARPRGRADHARPGRDVVDRGPRRRLLRRSRGRDRSPREELLQSPRHPYTRALLDALPHPELAADHPLVADRRRTPSPAAVPPDAPFHPRCAHRVETCATDVPELVHDGSRAFACPVDPFRA